MKHHPSEDRYLGNDLAPFHPLRSRSSRVQAKYPTPSLLLLMSSLAISCGDVDLSDETALVGDLESSIVGGQATNISSIPWQISLQRSGRSA